MGVHARVDGQTARRLGRAGVEKVCAQLWAQDCQSCGRPLGPRRPALVVDDLIVSAMASLHHVGCRRPDWNASGAVTMSGQALLSHITHTAAVSFDETVMGSGAASLRPMLLVNPGLEQVPLRRGDDTSADKEQWTVSTVEMFAQFGLQRSGPHGAGQLDAPVTGLGGRLVGERIVVSVGPQQWSTPLSGLTADLVRDRGGITLAVTTAIHPGEYADGSAMLDALVAAMLDGQVAVGFIGVDALDADTAKQLPTDEQLAALAGSTRPAPTGDVPPVTLYPGPSYDPATGRFEMGADSAGNRHHWTLHTPGHGMEHGLISGPPGCGKTSSLRLVLIEAVQTGLFTLMVADPLGGDGGLDPFDRIAHATARTPDDTVRLLQAAVAVLDGRRTDQRGPGRAQRFRDPDSEHPGWLVAIDNAEAVLADPAAAALAARLVADGGPAGIGLVVTTASVDPADFAGDITLLLGLAATNAFSMSHDHFEFLQSLRDTRQG